MDAPGPSSDDGPGLRRGELTVGRDVSEWWAEYGWVHGRVAGLKPDPSGEDDWVHIEYDDGDAEDVFLADAWRMVGQHAAVWVPLQALHARRPASVCMAAPHLVSRKYL
jgi:hypothetical protein